MASNRLLRVFLDVSMINGHDGLRRIAKEEKVSLSTLEPQEHVCFVNRAGNRIKIFSANNCVSYIRAVGSGRLDIGTLEHFAECFGANGFAYTDALRKVLLKRLKTSRVVEHRPWERVDNVRGKQSNISGERRSRSGS